MSSLSSVPILVMVVCSDPFRQIVALQTLPILALGFDDDVLHYGQNLRIKLCPFSESEAKLTANSSQTSTDKHTHIYSQRCVPGGDFPRVIGTTVWTSRISTDAYLHSEMVTGLAAAKFSRRALGCTRYASRSSQDLSACFNNLSDCPILQASGGDCFDCSQRGNSLAGGGLLWTPALTVS